MLKLMLIICLFSLQTLCAEGIFVGIAGGTGSGKTTLAEKILKNFSEDGILISQDSYYKDLSHLSLEERAKVNFDHPHSLDFEMLKEHLRDLKSQKVIEGPIYNFHTHSREEQTKEIKPAKLVIVEGILLFSDSELRDFFDLKIFIDADDDIRVLRRIDRDIHERSRDLASITKQYIDTVKPMHNAFVEPSKQYADVIVPNGGNFNQTALGTILAKINEDLSYN